MTGSVIPCHRGAKCSWPACEQGCDGRPGLEHATLPQKLAELRAKAERAASDDMTAWAEFEYSLTPAAVLALLAVVEAAQALTFAAYPAHGSGFVIQVTGGNIDDLAAALSSLARNL